MHDASFPPIKSSCGLGGGGGGGGWLQPELVLKWPAGTIKDCDWYIIACDLFTVFTGELPRFCLNRAQTLDSARNSLQRIICPLCLKAQLVQDLLKAGSDSTVQMFKHTRRVLVTSLPEAVWHNPAKIQMFNSFCSDSCSFFFKSPF